MTILLNGGAILSNSPGHATEICLIFISAFIFSHNEEISRSVAIGWIDGLGNHFSLD